MLKAHEDPVVDQYTDRSGAALVKIASTMADKGLARLAVDTLFALPNRAMRKEATFSTASARDTMLSRIYFEAQREKLAADKAASIADNLDKYEALYGLTHKVAFARPRHQVKQAELLPDCNVASREELFQAGQDFSCDFAKLASADRRTFAHNFVKAAAYFGLETVPETVRLYAEQNVQANPELCENILLRKVAMDRMGNTDNGFATLYNELRSCDVQQFTRDELHKIAEALDYADTVYQLRGVPDAWHSVYKLAEENDGEKNKADAADMSKADIISRFGEGVLEELEQDDGSIDRARLARIVQAFDGTEETHA